MDYAFLPEKIKRFVESEKLGETALCVIRGSGGFSGVPGESYLLAYSKLFYLFGKTFGESDFINRKVDYIADAPEISLHQDKFSGMLEICLGDGKLKMKLSSIEVENCSSLMKRFGMAPATPAAAQSAAPEDADLVPEPLTALAACMKHIAASDNKVGEPEQRLIEAVCQNNPVMLHRAESCFRRYSFSEILDRITLDEQQRLCFLANLYELAMSDGVLRSSEQRLIDEFVRLKKVTPENAATVREVLLIKNQLSVLAT